MAIHVSRAAWVVFGLIVTMQSAAWGATEAIRQTLDLSHVQPAIAVGDPTGSPSVAPADRLDANVPTSPFAGVVSLNPAKDGAALLCSGALIADHMILTAAHGLDFEGGVGGTGDGVADFLPSEVALVFNHNNPTSDLAGATVIDGVKEIHLHPDWHGFNNSGGPEGASINDDVAVLVLNDSAPAGVPRYGLNTDPFDWVTPIVMAGYGTTGDGVNGYTSGTADFFAKRTGQNVASVYDVDDELPRTARELFYFDFDGPDLTTSTLDAFGTVGNFFETTIGPGDSGGPSFLWDDDGDSVLETDELSLFGINTFTRGGGAIPSAPLFGSQAGGMVVSTYADFINSVPEPASAALLLVAGGLVFGRRIRCAA